CCKLIHREDLFSRIGYGDLILPRKGLPFYMEFSIYTKYFILSDEIIILDDAILYQSFGFYEPKYSFDNSEKYKNGLMKIREKQKTLATNKQATYHSDNWVVDGSKKKGEALNNDNIKMAVRAFNNECDAAIVNVKFSNVDAIEKRIRNAHKQLNKLNKKNRLR
ncbi:MAG: DUF4041 domain-containing protein, partial [Bacillaceae bacterium]|nr:DUF4041 domain-containing protein [Bacillaceae bacterium]